MIQVIGIEGFQIKLRDRQQFFQQLLRYLSVGIGDNLPGFLVYDALRHHLAHQIFRWDFELFHISLFHLPDVARRDTLVLLDERLLSLFDFESRDFATQPLRNQLQADIGFLDVEQVRSKETVQYLLYRIPQCPQKDGRRDLATPVNPAENQIFLVKLEIQPGPSVGNNPRGIKQFSRGMRLTLIMFKKHTG